MSHMSELAMVQEEEQQAQATDEAEQYQDCLMALADAISRGCETATLQTMKYQMSIDDRDYKVLIGAHTIMLTMTEAV